MAEALGVGQTPRAAVAGGAGLTDATKGRKDTVVGVEQAAV